MKSKYFLCVLLSIVVFIPMAFAGGEYQPVRGYSNGNTYNEYEISAAVISAMMGRAVSIMNVKSDDGDIFYVKYSRSDDGSIWTYKCKIDGTRVIWGTRDGRWRTHPADDIISYKDKSGKLIITTNTGIVKTFIKNDFY